MKKTIIAFMIFIMPYCMVKGQVSIRETGVVEKAVLRPARFDSLENISPQERGREYNIKKYLEQEIFIIPMSSAKTAQEQETKLKIDRANEERNRRQDSIEHLVRVYRDSITMLEKQTKLQNNLPFGHLLSNTKKARSLERVKKMYNTVWLKSLTSDNSGTKTYTPYSPYVSHSKGFYMCDSTGNATGRLRYADVHNRYYTIIDVMRGSMNEKGIGKFSRAEEFSYNLAFLLKERNNDNLILWFFDRLDDEKSGAVAILTSYFTKAKKAFEGEYLIATHDMPESVDINTGELIRIPKDSRWMCRELSLMSLENASLMEPFFILENHKGDAVKFKLSNKIGDIAYLPAGRFIIEKQHTYNEQQKQLHEEQRQAEQKAREEQRRKDEAQFRQTCINKYGQRLGSLICEGKVAVGMNREMCEMAWGTPDRVNRTITAGITHEQWVYGWNNYLYFDNGILKAIQD